MLLLYYDIAKLNLDLKCLLVKITSQDSYKQR